MQIAADTQGVARLADRLRHAGWMDEPGRTAAGFTLVDRLDLSSAVRLLLVAPTGLPDRWYAVLTDQDGTLLEASPEFDALVVDGMRQRRTLPTGCGGQVAFDGEPAAFEGTEALPVSWSSNHLSRVRLGGHPFVHKRYRVLSTAMHEPTAMRLLTGTGCLPDHAGDYAYVSPSGERYPLGVVYRFVDGEPLEDLFRAHMRTLWILLGDDAAVAEHMAGLDPVLDAVGSTLGRLHRALAERIAGGGLFDTGRCLTRTEQLAATVLDRLRTDERHAPAVRSRLAALLAQAVAGLPAGILAMPPVAAGICHGDLHLAQLLCRHTATGWTVRAIDPDPPALDPADPAYADQTPWQDLVALRRSIESFAVHEAAVEAARVLGTHRREVVRTAVHDALGRPGRAPGDEVRARLFAAAADWTGLTMRRILSAYPAAAVPQPLWRTLHLRRMLHELAYNQAHRRAYQVDVDLTQLAALAVTA